MTSGIVFDIEEFAVHDGPGIRTTVFLKGCPLACMWCHNPEGQSRMPQRLATALGSRIAGIEYTSQALAQRLNQEAVILKNSEGGVSFSGGEPLLQAEFIAEVIDQLDGLHVLLDTSGSGSEDDLRLLLERVDLVYYDLKLVDRAAHAASTGRDNDAILHNLGILAGSGVPYVIRVPLVPGVTDTDANLAAIAETVKGLPNLVQVDLLPYNRAAGGKYAAAGMEFKPTYDENQPVNANLRVFEAAGIKARRA